MWLELLCSPCFNLCAGRAKDSKQQKNERKKASGRNEGHLEAGIKERRKKEEEEKKKKKKKKKNSECAMCGIAAVLLGSSGTTKRAHTSSRKLRSYEGDHAISWSRCGGIVTADESGFLNLRKANGLVSEVFGSPEQLASLKGRVGRKCNDSSSSSYLYQCMAAIQPRAKFCCSF